MPETSPAPLVALEAAGKATILSYNVPDPMAYPGRNYIELPFDDDYFKAGLGEAPARAQLPGQPLDQIRPVVEAALGGQVVDVRAFPMVTQVVGGLGAFSARHAAAKGGVAARQWNPDTGESTPPCRIPATTRPRAEAPVAGREAGTSPATSAGTCRPG